MILFCRNSRHSEISVIHPEQRCRNHAYRGHGPPDALRLMRDLSEVMNERPAEPAADQRSDPDRQERKTHIGALLSWRRKERDVFVVARLLDDLAQRQDKQREDCPPDRRSKGKDQPRNRRDQGAQDYSLKRWYLARQEIYREGETDHSQPVGNQNDLDVSVRVDVAVNVAGQADVLLPEHNPVTREKH